MVARHSTHEIAIESCSVTTAATNVFRLCSLSANVNARHMCFGFIALKNNIFYGNLIEWRRLSYILTETSVFNTACDVTAVAVGTAADVVNTVKIAGTAFADDVDADIAFIVAVAVVAVVVGGLVFGAVALKKNRQLPSSAAAVISAVHHSVEQHSVRPQHVRRHPKRHIEPSRVASKGAEKWSHSERM